MITTETNARQVIKELERRYDEGGKAAQRAMGKRLGQAAQQIATRANRKVPVLFGDLFRSQEVTRIHNGWRIRYGGLASKYAHYQHETEGLRHSGPRPGKYVYRGRIAPHEGDPNGPSKWRRQGVRYAARYETTGQYQELKGQAHFLFGASDSAFDELWPRSLIAIAEAGRAAAERVFS